MLSLSVYLADMKDFDAMNEAYIAVSRLRSIFSSKVWQMQFLPKNPPSRTCIAAAALPGGVTVEIECIAQVWAVWPDL
jgi:2-iminobutanoate/2-iminopropanoate deaminase